MLSNRTGWNEQRIGKAGRERRSGRRTQHQRRARSSAGTNCGAEDDDDRVRLGQQVTGRPVSADVTSASNAVIVASICSSVIG